jgi:tRNA-(ms[2]io[6]A)-hydroxylase
VFRLSFATPVEWVARVETDPLALLSDHAHCELKAAASAQALIVKNPSRTALVSRMAEIAREEIEHFALVAKLLTARGGALVADTPNPYTESLLGRSHYGRVCADDARDEMLLDRLLVSSLIEARSLERFHLLATHLADRELAEFYRALIPAESMHQALFRELALECYPAERVARRLETITALEGDIVSKLPFAVRMHSGLAPVEVVRPLVPR